MELRDLLPEPRSAMDVVSKRIRLLVDGEEFVLPVLPMRDNRAWKDRLSGEVLKVLGDVDDATDVNAIFAALDAAPERFMDLLLTYDVNGFLPDREAIEAVWTEVDLLMACLEVWRAASPLVDIGLGVIETTARQTGFFSRLTNRAWPSGVGPTTTSREN